MRRALVTAGLAGLLLVSGCGVRPSGMNTVASAPVEAQVMTDDQVLSEIDPNVREIYLLFREKPTPVVRFVGPVDDADLLLVLLDGPTPAERSAGLSTALPPSVSLVSAERSEQGVVVTLGNGGTPLGRLAEQQIACTLMTPDHTEAMVFLYELGTQPRLLACEY
ncbi:hypothetical protein [Pseudonocardia sp. ICBG1142]|uniref:hypothetical protein n=1 Tax=Pseudonocardia sp. ICBG1142 TaxID=2846760 RepID=UPI001CF64523|nr:hypothetical protein [Pseudonocardia sp. ICBG1142]